MADGDLEVASGMICPSDRPDLLRAGWCTGGAIKDCYYKNQ